MTKRRLARHDLIEPLSLVMSKPIRPNHLLSMIALMLAALISLVPAGVKASPGKTIKPKEVHYATSLWHGTDSKSGYQITLQLNSNLSMGVVKNDPFYLCSGTWTLIDITIPEKDSLLAGVSTTIKNADIPATVLEKINLNQVKAQFALDKNNNFGLACELGKFSPSSNSTVSQNMPSIPGWKRLIINSIDNQFVNKTLAKDVVYEFVGTLRKDTTAKIAEHKPRILDVAIELSAFKVWLADLAQQKLLGSKRLEQDQQIVQQLAYSDGQGFDDQQFDLFMQGLYEQRRLNEGTANIEQRFTENLSSSQDLSGVSYVNRTCANSEALEQVMGSWFSGTSMFKLIKQCHSVAPDYGFVRTEHCAVNSSIREAIPYQESSQTNSLAEQPTEPLKLPALEGLMAGNEQFCPKPLMQFVSLKNGNQVSQPIFLQTSGFSKHGLAAVQLDDNRWKVVTSSFNTLKPLPDIIGFRGGFHHDRIVFRSSNGLYGAMDPRFNIVIPAKYEEIQSFSSRITRVKYQGSFGVINRAGHWVVPAKFNRAGYVENGHILVRENDKSESPWLLINSEGILIKQTTSAGNIPPPMQALLR